MIDDALNTPPPRGYSIPFIDLTDDVSRQILVDRQAGEYLGHPTTVLLDDKRTILIVYPIGHGSGPIVYKRSTDGGLTWSDRLSVPENWSTSKEVPTIYPVRKNGELKRLIMFSGLYPIRMAVSEDLGASWSPLEPIGEFGGVVAMSDMMPLHDGTVMALFHDDGRFIGGENRRTGVFTVYKTISVDVGLTWSEPAAAVQKEKVHLCEPGLIRSPDGSEIAMVLRENSRLHNSHITFSNDEGNTWSVPREIPGALTGDRHKLRYAPDGRIVAVFRDMAHESPTHGDFVAWIGTYDDLAGGREGQYRVRLKENHSGPEQRIDSADCGYPGLELLPDGTFVATTYGHWEDQQQPYILSFRFRIDEIDSKVDY